MRSVRETALAASDHLLPAGTGVAAAAVAGVEERAILLTTESSPAGVYAQGATADVGATPRDSSSLSSSSHTAGCLIGVAAGPTSPPRAPPAEPGRQPPADPGRARLLAEPGRERRLMTAPSWPLVMTPRDAALPGRDAALLGRLQPPRPGSPSALSVPAVSALMAQSGSEPDGRSERAAATGASAANGAAADGRRVVAPRARSSEMAAILDCDAATRSRSELILAAREAAAPARNGPV